MSIRHESLAAFFADRSPHRRDAVIAAFDYLCDRGAKKFLRPGLDRCDLRQVAAIGLIKAVDHYDERVGTPFEAYAWQFIVGELMHDVRDHERLVRVPRRLRGLEKQYAAAVDALLGRLDRAPTAVEIAGEMRVSVPLLDELRMLRGGHVVSIESSTGSPVGEFPASRAGLSVDERLALKVALSELRPRERNIVLGAFAAGLSQAEIGSRLGLSQSQVSKLLKKALGELQRRVA